MKYLCPKCGYEGLNNPIDSDVKMLEGDSPDTCDYCGYSSELERESTGNRLLFGIAFFIIILAGLATILDK